jgi:hypothetical protein
MSLSMVRCHKKMNCKNVLCKKFHIKNTVEESEEYNALCLNGMKCSCKNCRLKHFFKSCQFGRDCYGIKGKCKFDHPFMNNTRICPGAPKKKIINVAAFNGNYNVLCNYPANYLVCPQTPVKHYKIHLYRCRFGSNCVRANCRYSHA